MLMTAGKRCAAECPLERGDEGADRGCALRGGGEPFLFPGIVRLLEHLHGPGMFVSIDSNGTRLANFAGDLVRLGGIHVTLSVDGPGGSANAAARGRPAPAAGAAPGTWRMSAAERRACAGLVLHDGARRTAGTGANS